MNNFNFKGVTIQTWVRTIVLIIALIGQLLVILGRKTEAINIDQWTEYVTYAVTAISSVWAWWENNSFTRKAQEADNILNGGADHE
ncbi:MAG: phage holin [Clostridiaceae bacterium]|nr:phage holin [Clostridiaceae bacterium]